MNRFQIQSHTFGHSLNKNGLNIIKLFNKILSTAVEQAVACGPVTQRVRVRSPAGTSFMGEVPEYHLAVISILSKSIHLVRMNGCVNGVYHLSCSCCLGSGPGIELIPNPERPSMSLCGQKSMYAIQS